jgi:hypothetical protein
MARNRLAGSKRGKSKSAKFYQKNKAARLKKIAYDTKYHSTKERRKYRADLQRKNIEAGTHGNHDNKDMDHVSKTRMVSRSASANRGDKSKRVFKRKSR